MTDLNVLIVHKDLNYVKQALNSIHWSKLNMKIAALISGGDAALALMRQQTYNIIFSDIDTHCSNGSSFILHAAHNNPETLFLAIAPSSAAAQLVPILRCENVYDYIDAVLDPREIESALVRASQAYSKQQLGKAAENLLNLDAFDIPPALKKNIRTNLRAILKNTAAANVSALAQDVSILFHETLSPQCKGDIAVSKAAAIELVFQLRYFLLNQNLECDDKLVPRSFIQKIQATMTNEDLEDLCLYYLRRGIQIINPNGAANQVSSLVRAAFKITRQRYSDPSFTLVSLSEEIGISPNYLSSVFKMETGIRFKKYLNSYRIEQAKELLMDSNYKIYEVANLVGIEDSRYFSQIFRTYTGLKPSEFRNAFIYDHGGPSNDEES